MLMIATIRTRSIYAALLISALLALGAAAPSSAFAQETRSAVAGRSPPAAQVEDLAWLSGQWVGPGISGPASASYGPPLGGVIIGHFVQTNAEGGTSFYELLQIAPFQGSLILRIKHFHPDMTGWEEAGQVQQFALVAVEEDAWYFDGVTIRRDGEDGMVAAVLVQQRDGSTEELIFRYRRSD